MKSLLWMAALGAALYFGYQWWDQHMVGSLDRPHQEASYGGGPVREWQQAPGAVVDMHRATGGGGSGPANAARDSVKKSLGR